MIGELCCCGNPKPLTECCGPFLTGLRLGATAEELMRSRYTAYCQRDAAYLRKTWHPETCPVALDFSGDDTEWLGLEITHCEAGGAEDEAGIVEFTARYRLAGALRCLRERSRFVNASGVWLYLDGIVQAEPKPGRNEPCGCGSGRKYKKCCGLTANSPAKS